MVNGAEDRPFADLANPLNGTADRPRASDRRCFGANSATLRGNADTADQGAFRSTNRQSKAGRGMGLALAAELSCYPGPSHLLELSRSVGSVGEPAGNDQRAVRSDV